MCQIETGSCSGPGMVGITLGGGVGRFTEIYGLVADALVSARLIIASGDVVEVSDTSHPDLFWAIRGAGANFGVVTSATYRLHKRSSEKGEVTNIHMIFPAEMSSAYFKALESYEATPERLASVSVIHHSQDTNKVGSSAPLN